MTATPFWPAEWAAQDGVLIAWPHQGTDWAANLDDVEATYAHLVAAIARRQDVLVCVADADIERRMRDRLAAAAVDPARIRVARIDYDDTWLRDSGPITLLSDAGAVLLDFRFTGWGGKFESGRDDRLVGGLIDREAFARGIGHRRVDFALEGGAVETDGEGTLLSTWQCLATRHPGLDRAAVERRLAGALAVDRFLWLDHGALSGDDTDAHIDTLARFAAVDRIVFQACDDPGDDHFAPLAAMAAELAAFRTRSGSAYELHPLPWPRPVHDAGGRRLAASYANFLIINDAVLMPGYGDPADQVAAAVLARAFPGRSIEVVPCRPLIEQNGSLHCLTMQLPRGVLRR
jgi:agmatine/peptidylarginine deiminase